MKKALITFLLFFALLLPYSLCADNIRGNVVNNILLTDTNTADKFEFSMSIEDVFAVSIDKNSQLIKGFELEFSVPPGLRSYRNSFALNIYKQVSPAVSTGVGTYYGKKYHSFILPDTVKFYIQIPYKVNLDNENSPYTTIINNITSFSDTPMMVTILPMMKGFPTSLYSNNFKVSVKPLLKDVGTLFYRIDLPEGLNASQLSVKIDDNSSSFSPSGTRVNLTEGSHAITVEIPGGKTVSRNFSVSTGKTTELDIEIEKLQSFAVFEIPDVATVYLDGEKQQLGPDSMIEVEPGMHTVLFKVGDYKISKNFNISPGKDCKISLFLDIFVEEN